jgi:ubiquinone/menaquinone biosynthesis C-methylase UbiE
MAAMKLDAVQQAAQEQFGRQSQHYGRGHVLEDISDVHHAIERMDLPAKAKALDIATGAGHTGLFVASLGHEVTLADISPQMLDHAAEAALARGLTVTTRQHTAEQLPYSNATFDLVTSRVAPHHFSSPESFIRETARVLKPRGYFLLIDGTVEDGQPEPEAWAHEVEKLRDPSHNRLLTPRAWSALCHEAGLHVDWFEIEPFKQPDLEWYFQTAATSPENRVKVLKLVDDAPESARALFKVAREDGKIVWWWQRLTLVARRP